ncbi:hypothetical protein C8F04DRAFT_1103015 [Mycena alexandri]|uniref:F-box domain-containing protein n=1 Tax=Mycena alexandri TaxID=1745969 RepID=A0AAD6X6L9_9AGAR|nr:hypothetical protein C8F04DRAFT_1103015 [Mycena alexandri]
MDYLSRRLRSRQRSTNDAQRSQALNLDSVPPAITYPVLTLPVEIVSQIFSWTLVPGGPTSPFSAERKSLILGHIGRLWRQIALSTPELWNVMHLTIGRGPLEPTCIHTFFSRAASLPLSISVNTEFYNNWDALRTTLNAIVPYSRAWGNLSISARGEDLQPLQAIRELPHLESLTLILVDAEDGMLATMFQNAPLLRKAHLAWIGCQRAALPWSQLTSLHLDGFTWNHFGEMLGWTPGLVDLIIGPLSGAIHTPHLPPLPRLRSVIFSGTEIPLQTVILSRLEAPLRVLRISVRGDLAPFALPMAHPASLERLSVDIRSTYARVSASPSIESLNDMSSLRLLKITVHDYDPTAIFALDPLILRLAEDAGFLPVLESLAIILLEHYSALHIPFDAQIMTDMLCARWLSGLRHFELRSRRPLPDLGEKAVDLEARGMHIHLETSPTLEVHFNRAEILNPTHSYH